MREFRNVFPRTFQSWDSFKATFVLFFVTLYMSIGMGLLFPAFVLGRMVSVVYPFIVFARAHLHLRFLFACGFSDSFAASVAMGVCPFDLWWMSASTKKAWLVKCEAI